MRAAFFLLAKSTILVTQGPQKSQSTEKHIYFRASQGKKQIRRYHHHCKRIRNETETRRQKKKKKSVADKNRRRDK